MELLDLPPELFERVVHEIVEQEGIHRACELREVCSK